jgi:hypothetical protein
LRASTTAAARWARHTLGDFFLNRLAVPDSA